MNLSPNNPGAEAPEPTETPSEGNLESPEETAGAEVAPPPIEELGDEPEDTNEVEAKEPEPFSEPKPDPEDANEDGVAMSAEEIGRMALAGVGALHERLDKLEATMAQAGPNRPVAGKAQPIESDTLVILVKGPTNIHAKVVFRGQLQEVGAFGLGDVGNAALAAWDALRKCEEKAPQG